MTPRTGYVMGEWPLLAEPRLDAPAVRALGSGTVVDVLGRMIDLYLVRVRHLRLVGWIDMLAVGVIHGG